ncbi:MAG: PKD domain-containing protein [Bacteroidota bacterium]
MIRRNWLLYIKLLLISGLFLPSRFMYGQYGVTERILYKEASSYLQLYPHHKDYSFFDILNPPNISDTIFCGGGEHLIQFSSESSEYVWRDSASGGEIIHVGNSLSIFSDEVPFDTSYFVSLVNKVAQGNVGLGTHVSGLLRKDRPRGSKFNTYQPLIIDSVSVYADNPCTLTITLRDESNEVLATKAVEVENGNEEESIVALGFNVPVGNNFSLLVESIIGGNLIVENVGVEYPYSIPSLIDITNNTVGFAGLFYYLFNWKVSTLDLANESDRVPFNVRINTSPTVDLGSDTTVCGDDYLLNVADEGANYLWNTGDTNDSLQVTSDGTYILEATLGSCKSSDTVTVSILGLPPTPIVEDTTVCSSDVYTISVEDNGFGYTWWRDENSLTPLSFENQIVEQINDTTTYYIESSKLVNLGRVGLENSSSALFRTQPRGLTFNTERLIRIDTVDAYLSGNSAMTIELWDENDHLLLSKEFLVEGNYPNPTPIPLRFIVPEGNGYKLMVSSFEGSGEAGVEVENVQFPYTLEGAVSITSTTSGFTNLYYYLYDWKVSTFNQGCSSDRLPLTVNVKIPLALEDSIYSCTDVSIGGENPSLLYDWNTGDISNIITVAETGLYSVAVSDAAGCLVKDSTYIEIPVPVGLPNDGIFCGNEMRTNYGRESTINWSTGDTTETISITNPGEYFVSVLEPKGCELRDTITVVGFDTFPVVDLGPDIGACDSLVLDAGTDGVSYQWSTGDNSQQLTVAASGLYHVSVSNENACITRDTIALLIVKKPNPSFSYTVEGLKVSFFITSNFADYQWEFGDGSSITVFDPIHFYQQAGAYTVRLIGSNSCGRDTIEEEISVGIALSNDFSLPEYNWQVYPNPSNGKIFLEIHQQQLPGEEIVLSLTNSLGEVVKVHSTITPGRKAEIDLSTYAKGLYYLSLKIGNLHGAKAILLQ